MKNPNVYYKYRTAKQWYAKGRYVQTIPIIEDLISHYKGTDTAEQLYYLLAEGYYRNEEYLIAAYHFKTYNDLYPNGDKAEDALFYNALCYFNESPKPSLDQTETANAISNLQLFINQYPNSKKIDTCNQFMAMLRRKLELKAYEAAKLYYHTQNYKAAEVSLRLVLKEYPDIAEREEIAYMAMLSNYFYADKSIFSKQPERYLAANEATALFESEFKNSDKLKEIPLLLEKGYFKSIQTAYNWAQSTSGDKRIEAFELAIKNYQEYASLLKETKNKEQALNLLNKSYQGIIKTNFYLAEELKENGASALRYNACVEAYKNYINAFPTKVTKDLEEIYLQALEKLNKLNNTPL